MSTSATADHATVVELDVHDGVAWIRLNGPATRNALDTESARSLREACQSISDRPDIGCVVIAGHGRSFCSGADRRVLSGIGSDGNQSAIFGLLAELYSGFQAVAALPVPTIAAVNGAAVGAGLNLVMATDIRIASEDALFVSGFRQVGVHPGGGHLHLLGRSGGRQLAAAMGILGVPVDARRAAELGLVWECVPSGKLDDHVHAHARRVAEDPDLARALKATLRMSDQDDAAWQYGIEIERSRQVWSFARRPAEG
jgi:enoyl-CoA hydratase